MRRFSVLQALVLSVGLGVLPATGASQAATVPPIAVAESSGTAHRGNGVEIRRGFNLATFNVLGNDHTRGRDGFGSGVARMALTVRAFRKADLDVIALQEFEEEQWRAFRRQTGGRYQVWADEKHIANAVAWRTSKFAFVRARTIGVPYFSGNIRQMPVVFLRLRATGQTMAFTSFHNPVSNKKHPGNAKWRQRATTREITLANNLRKRDYPAFLSGDFNDRSKQWQCRVARATNMVTAGNGDRQGGSCRPLSRMRIDWIFGSDGVIFSRYAAVESQLVNRASDHPLIVVHVR